MNLSGLKPSKGFSLLELLVAIALMGVVTTLGIQAFSMLTSAFHETRVLSELNDKAEDAFKDIEKVMADTLSASLSGVSIIGVDREIENKREINRQGNADDRLIIPILETGGPLQVSRSIQYQVFREEGRSLLAKTVGSLGDANPSSQRNNIIPDCDVIRFDVTYATGNTDEPWVNSWTSSELPRAVRVSMTLSEEDNITRQISRKAIYEVHVR